MPEIQARDTVVQETLQLLGTDAPSLRTRVEAIVDHLPHIFSYDAPQRAQMVRYHLLQVLRMGR